MNPTSSSTTSLLTYEDYCQLPDDGNRYELIEGVLYTHSYMSPSPALKHQRVLGRLFRLLSDHVDGAALGEVFVAPFDVYLSDYDVVQPDILFIASDRESILTNKNVQGAPNLVIEILSEGNRRHDEVDKRKLYEQYRAEEYWIVDPELETIKIYLLHNDAYGPATLLSLEHDETLTSKVMPNLSLKLSEIF